MVFFFFWEEVGVCCYIFIVEFGRVFGGKVRRSVYFLNWDFLILIKENFYREGESF